MTDAATFPIAPPIRGSRAMSKAEARTPARPAQSVAAAELTDAELARRVQEGDVNAYDLLVGRHLKKAYRVAYRYLNQAQDAEDLVQEAFIAALRRIDSFDSTRPFAPWFYRILVNRCLNARKSRARRGTVELSREVVSGRASPLLEAERSELRQQLREAMEELPDRQKTIVALSDVEGFTSPEIAEMLNITDGTVRWHLHQARRVLRNALEPLLRRKA